jgi:predicted nucleotidyltransferase
MNEKEMAKNNKILECRVGSHLYGTNTENSDEDYSGVFIADLKYYFGLKSIEEVSDNVVSKQENGKNNKDAIDKKYTELRRFVQLALQNNPNVVELLFLNDSNIIYQDENWKKIISNREYFLSSKQIKDRFKGYAFSQKHKALKIDNILQNLKVTLEKDKNKKLGHLIRILFEGLELLQNKNITFPLKERELILDIKKGKYTCDQVLSIADELEKEIDSLQITEFKQDHNKIENMLVNILSNKFNIF